MGDSTVTAALEAAAKRGVDVTVVMTADSEWNSAFAALRRAGVHVHTFPDSSSVLYIHAKAVVADAGRSGQQVFVGSENFSAASLRREQGTRHPDGERGGDLRDQRHDSQRLRPRLGRRPPGGAVTSARRPSGLTGDATFEALHCREMLTV